MTTGAIRGAILLAAVVIGAVIISNAFPSVGGPTSSTSPATSPSVKPSTPVTPNKPHLTCPTSHKGIQVAVENATTTAGLAAATAQTLKNAGYTVNGDTDIGTATTESQTTRVYFRTADDKLAARCLKKKFFSTATVAKLPAGSSGTTPPLAPTVQVAVFLGSDYATTHPVP